MADEEKKKRGTLIPDIKAKEDRAKFEKRDEVETFVHKKLKTVGYHRHTGFDSPKIKASDLDGSASPSVLYIPLFGNDNSTSSGSYTDITSSNISLTDTDYTGYDITFVAIISTSAGTATAQFWNSTDSSEITTVTTTGSASIRSSAITLTSGTKNYRIRIKTTSGTVFIYSAHLRLDKS
jgi:hypothetical protein